ncbi:MAG: hypothetical protein ABI378_14885, partial [Chitinophagaceae bacterium]
FIYGSARIAKEIGSGAKSISDFMKSFEGLANAGDYVAFLPYFLKTDSREAMLGDWRLQVRNERKVATTLLTGPRYLHSTGQLHKGGPNSGLYIILVGNEGKQLAIPDEKFGFATLHEAQSKGDFKSLDEKGRRVILINLGNDVDKGLAKLSSLIQASNS